MFMHPIRGRCTTVIPHFLTDSYFSLKRHNRQLVPPKVLLGIYYYSFTPSKKKITRYLRQRD